MKYCVYKLYNDNPTFEHIVEYFESLIDAKKFAKTITKSSLYQVFIGEFI